MSDSTAAAMRGAVERVLRLGALATLSVLLWRQWPRSASSRSGAALSIALSSAAANDSTGAATATALRALAVAEPAPVALRLTALPTARSRGAIAALAAAALAPSGAVTWVDSTHATGLAVGAVSTIDPDSRIVITASGARGRPLVVADAGGVLDSVTLASPTMSLIVRRSDAHLTARSGASVATIDVPPALPTRRILLYGRPGWESKFTIAALEESGWTVDASLPVAPRASVTVGAPLTPDTARYAAVIVLDSGLARAATLARFVRDGGGLVVSGDALRDRALAGLVPARVGDIRAQIPGGLLSPSPVSGLDAVRLAAHADAVVLQRDVGGAPATVVERSGGGRIAAAAYREVWRWRMEGAADGGDAHRGYWNGLLRAVGYSGAPVRRAATDSAGGRMDNAAPYAALVDRLGPPSSAPVAAPRTAETATRGRLDIILLIASLTALVAEWASRRLRGAR